LVSWGPDSMLMAHLFLSFMETQDTQNHLVFIIHYNHKQRKESDIEEKSLRRYFQNYSCVFGEYFWEKITEQALREARRDFVHTTIKKHGAWVVYTWHNLSDRLETSCLNILRGCKRQWLYAMSGLDVSITFYRKLTICRPLINISKKNIKSICETHSVPFEEDTSNYDTFLSQRNSIRKKIHTLWLFLVFEDKTYSSFYETRHIPQKIPILCVMHLPDFFPNDSYYKLKRDITLESLYSLFFFLWCNYWMTSSRLHEMYWFLSWWTAWRKHVSGRIFCIAHDYIYIFKSSWDTPFWIDSVLTQEIQTMLVILHKDLLIPWQKLRFIESGDVYWSSRLSKYFIKNKIPFFFRKYIPIVVDDTKVVRVLTSISSLWYT
jgi:tRNA(Ile)-lysidine synthetase-like protein